MKRIILTCLLSFPILTACAEKPAKMNNNHIPEELMLETANVSTGTGILEISFTEPVPLYRTEKDTEPFDVLRFEKQRDGTMHFNIPCIGSGLQPYVLFVGDSDEEGNQHVGMGLIHFPPQLLFRVLEVTDEYFKVVVNEHEFKTVVIRRNPHYAVIAQRSFFSPAVPTDRKYSGYYVYETWESILLRAEFVNFNAPYSVYDEPDGQVVFENTDHKFLPYSVTEVSGDWIKVKKGGGREFNFEGIKNAEGWIRWRNDREILVQITEWTVE